MSGVRLSLRAQGLGSWLKYLLRGRALFARVLSDLSRAQSADPLARQRAQQSASRLLLDHLEVRLDQHGLQHLPSQPHIIAPLHEGLADPLVLTQLGLPMRFVLRDEILTWPSVGPALSSLGHLAINPEQGANGYRRLLREAGAITRKEHLVLFPQGSVLGLEIDFQRGVFALCKALELPLLPVVLTGTHHIWEHPFSPTLRYGVRVRMEVMEPIPAEVFQYEPLEVLRLDLQARMKQLALASAVAPRRYVPERDGWWDGFKFSIDPGFAELAARVQAHKRALEVTKVYPRLERQSLLRCRGADPSLKSSSDWAATTLRRKVPPFGRN